MENSLRYVKLLPIVLKLLPYTFALPFGQRFSIPLCAGFRWFRACGIFLCLHLCGSKPRVIYKSATKDVEALMNKTSVLFIYF